MYQTQPVGVRGAGEENFDVRSSHQDNYHPFRICTRLPSPYTHVAFAIVAGRPITVSDHTSPRNHPDDSHNRGFSRAMGYGPKELAEGTWLLQVLSDSKCELRVLDVSYQH